MSYRDRSWGYQWAPYVSVATRHRTARAHVARLRKKGRDTSPVVIEGRTIATTFWGRAWCDNLESYSDFANRLPRGRTYVRNGSVIDLQVGEGEITSLVSGSSIYEIKIDIERLAPKQWKGLVHECAGGIGSLVELLQGRFSRAVMEVLARPRTGLFPAPDEISFSCSCPDGAWMCKHVAATLYGVGARLDDRPELFFTLRRVDQTDLVAAATSGRGLAVAASDHAAPAIAASDLGSTFGIEIDTEPGADPRTVIDVAARVSAANDTTMVERPADPQGVRTRQPVAARRSRSRTSAAKGGRSALDMLFRTGAEVTAELLLAFGVPRSTFQNWVTSRVLSPSGSRGIYLATAQTADRIRTTLERQKRRAES